MSAMDDTGPAPDDYTDHGELPDDELHILEDAHITCRGAWLYPRDHEIRSAAYFAVARCGMDYVELLAATIERGVRPDGAPFTVEQARRAIAESFRKLAEQSYAHTGFTDPARRLLSDPDETADPFDPRGGGGGDLDAIGGP